MCLQKLTRGRCAKVATGPSKASQDQILSLSLTPCMKFVAARLLLDALLYFPVQVLGSVREQGQSDAQED